MKTLYNIEKLKTVADILTLCRSIGNELSPCDVIICSNMNPKDFIYSLSDNPRIAKNSVLAVRAQVIMLDYESEESVKRFFDLAEKWIIRTFGREKIYYMARVCSEKKCVLESVLMPIRNEGRLSASHYFGGREKLSAFQETLFNTMAPLGAEPRKKRSVASYDDVSEYFAAADSASASAPVPSPNETPEEYFLRAQAEYKKLNYQLLHEVLLFKQLANITNTFLQRRKPKKGKAPIGTPGEYILYYSRRLDRLKQLDVIKAYWLNYARTIASSSLPEKEKLKHLCALDDAADKGRRY